MNRITIALLLFIALVMSSCTTSKSVVSQHVDLSKYKYASVINNDTYHIPNELMQYEIMLFDAVQESRLQLVNEYRIEDLTPDEQAQLLLVKYGVEVEYAQTVVTVNFIDFLTGRPVASCRGAYGSLSISETADIKGAIREVAKQVAITFPKRN